MNSFSNNIVKHKAKIEEVVRLDMNVSLHNPREYNKSMYVCSYAGEIIKFSDDGNYQVYVIWGGQPSCVALDQNDMLYFADVANAAVFFREQPNDEIKSPEMQILLKEYEGMPLKGPVSVALNIDENCLLVCDTGYFGTTSLNTPSGSLYTVDLDSKISRPLLLNCLAYPSDVVYCHESKITYLVETFTNRVIRLVQSPPDVYHSSIFHQFSGRVGPTSIAVDEVGNIYVARYEFQNEQGDVDGVISVLNKDGYLVGDLIIPKMSEITGICIPSDNSEVLYFTEKHFNGVMKVSLTSFIAEVDKMLEINKF